MVIKRSIQFIVLVLLAISLKMGWNSLQRGEIFPISVVKVEADYTHFSPEDLRQMISSHLPASFWTVNLSSLNTRLHTIAWVQSVRIKKIWPETLKIQIHEKKALAKWGQNGFISKNKEVFYPENYPSSSPALGNLPWLYGPEEQAKTVAQQYYTMSRLLKAKHLTIQRLLMSRSGAWSLSLSNGMELLLGSKDPLQRLARFLRVYDGVFNSEQERVARRIDLRYPHGMAVSWINNKL